MNGRLNSDGEDGVDIVIPWVDCCDPSWQTSIALYSDLSLGGDKKISLYRSLDLMRYWFRGIEKNMPWIRKIHFVTSGHYPEWLNTSNGKIQIVRHCDFIPCEYLPLFSSNVIEMFIHKIPSLSERFIYFNDDFFIIDRVDEVCFFKNGYPCDMAVLNSIMPVGICNFVLNSVLAVNRNFDRKSVLLGEFNKWFNFKYGFDLFRTILMLPWPRFPGFVDHHLPQPYLKNTFSTVWLNEESLLINTARSRFRSAGDVNQYVFRYWQLCSGNFHPCNVKKKGAFFILNERSISDVARYVSNKVRPIVVINDSEDYDFDRADKELQLAFQKILPMKCSFEV